MPLFAPSPPRGTAVAVGSQPTVATRDTQARLDALPSDYALMQQGVRLATGTLNLPTAHGEIINTQAGDYQNTVQSVLDPMTGAYTQAVIQVDVGSQQHQTLGAAALVDGFSVLARTVDDNSYRQVVSGSAPPAVSIASQHAVVNTVLPALSVDGTFILAGVRAGAIDTGNGHFAATVDPNLFAPAPSADTAAAAVGQGIADAGGSVPGL